jgi:hypothetical protein
MINSKRLINTVSRTTSYYIVSRTTSYYISFLIFIYVVQLILHNLLTDVQVSEQKLSKVHGLQSGSNALNIS